MINEHDVAAHYSRPGLLEQIHAALRAMGRLDQPTPEDLSLVDQFHSGGHRATAEIAASLMLRADLDVLDVGCGIGGPARYLAGRHGCRVVGLDLTPDYIATADALTRLVGLADRARFVTGSATSLPFDATSFDRVVMLHVGMNIADKTAMAREAFRVLRSGGLIVIYDPMRTGTGDIAYPLPWASGPEGSWLEPPEVYRSALTAAGFTIQTERNRLQLVLTGLAERYKDPDGPGPHLTLDLHLGPDARTKRGNMAALLRGGIISPLEIVARKS